MTRALPDPFFLVIIATVSLATVLPVHSEAAVTLNLVATAAVVLLFFLHGVKLPRENLIAALTNWRLHFFILLMTYLLLPVFGLVISRIWPSLLPTSLWAGVLFLCALPSTVQMSIAYTSVAKGNVAAAVTSAAASNLLGIALTPLIAGLLLSTQSGTPPPLSGIWKVVLQLLLPFVCGHLLRPWLGKWAERNKVLVSYSDRLTILLSVYGAFSAAVIAGIWAKIPLVTLLTLVAICFCLLSLGMLSNWMLSRTIGLTNPERRAALFCGSFKSLVSGVPMARVLFPSAELGAMILPVMIYHQLQLMISAIVAPRQARQKT
jgi:solute carrier family 10 (sodium/bile acid cotransporter), member 7